MMTNPPATTGEPQSGHIGYDLVGDVARIVISHPPTRNALSCAMATDLKRALSTSQDEARAVLLTGDGGAFCSGANVFDDTAMGVDHDDGGEVLETHFNPLIRTMRELRIPIVSAIGGPVAGFGVSLALCGDIIIAARSAFFRMAFCDLGLIPDGGLTYMLVRTLGRARAMHLLMSGERFPAEIAAEWGVVTQLVEDAELEALSLTEASKLAAGPTKTIGAIRRMAWVAMEQTFEEELCLERSIQRTIAGRRDFHEGIAAFREHRAARFKGE